MRTPARFALNHIVAPHAELDAFLAVAAALGIDAVEIRNDLPGVAMADGTAASTVRALTEKHGLALLSINALQRFNDWNDTRAAQAKALAAYCQACGAQALVMCPVNDWQFRPGERARLDGLRRALSELAPILAGHGIVGLVEPLGFTESSLRLKRDAVEAIDAVGAASTFRVVHDTFHHAIAGEDAFFPERTGLVHISGVEDVSLPFASMRDPHRVLVGPRDRLGNVEQIRRLVDGGYAGRFSFEPFAKIAPTLPDIASAVRESMAFLTPARDSDAA
jgi:2-keto-myo-inositol isomerase